MRKSLFHFVMVVLVGCGREDWAQLNATAQTLQNANKIIQEDNLTIQDALGEKRRDPVYHTYGEIWEPKASQIKGKADSIVAFIEELKNELIKQSDSLNKADAPLIPAFFIVTDTVDSSSYSAYLKKDLMFYRNNGPLLPGYAENLNEVQRTDYINKWLDNNLRGSSPLMTMIILNKLKNDVLYTRTALMDFCNSKVGMLDGPGSYEKFSIIAVVNSNYVKRGQTIELTAGAAEFSTARKPRVLINDKEVKLDDQSVALYKFKATGAPGKYVIPVNIELTNRNGSRQTFTKKVEYTIADEK